MLHQIKLNLIRKKRKSRKTSWSLQFERHIFCYLEVEVSDQTRDLCKTRLWLKCDGARAARVAFDTSPVFKSLQASWGTTVSFATELAFKYSNTMPSHKVISSLAFSHYLQFCLVR